MKIIEIYYKIIIITLIASIGCIVLVEILTLIDKIIEKNKNRNK